MKVYFRQCESYDRVEKVLLPLLAKYSHIFEKGDRVLVKPNLLSAREPNEGVTTHPEVLKTILKFLISLETRPFVGDSPASGSFKKVIAHTGISQICEKLSVPIVELDDPVEVDGEIYKKIKISSKVFQADKVVNVAKLKTHSQMIFTMGVKNTFGCVPGFEKSGWHIRCAHNENFASLLVDIHLLVKPVLTILDGIIGMEGNGPANGKLKQFNMLVVGENAFAVDHAVCKRIGVNPEIVFVLKEAIKRNLIPDYEIDGNWSDTIKLPVTAETLPVPGMLKNLARKIIRVPKISKKRCVQCRICEERCPAKAIDISNYFISYNKCIRCYVCHEVCPRGAIDLIRKFL
ncbi:MULTISPECIES: DUF362 domain-containing protein [Pseudothermotoga]|uniref:4Fe-4S ferredoxin-type domain-containing protein n=1 Tax=Pseudothermotoga lettingae (strain ATCC BAA-301 / DSM 14385 / NBRC 107922 / TMO) TaxID=416591 RepID=A8F5L0_PSELT|nr:MULTISPECIES: DUF362 domain-containing protein [Pseudothermotoga]ABV33444.1 protein of unknown function DUF362 [Pseudothermotoga lettingae TMO]KUK21592.1 MAG: Uncharacterized protein XD56_0490 [Pseudothermotoga lettingae]MDK2883907.1 hypothetical protein [Pseudothermotoga sp.]GLI49642.1 hypothetical protein PLETTINGATMO_18110 [Pseudothermotoga lettingae TMO]HBJ80847.1 DUF362 domain-containing protein [Pseudothermotoga sp.]